METLILQVNDLNRQVLNLENKLDEKNVIIGRLNDDVMRLTKAVETRDEKIKALQEDNLSMRRVLDGVYI